MGVQPAREPYQRMTAVLDENLLAAFESSLRAVKAPIVNHWAPGLDDARIDELIAPFALDLPEEARVWWRWHNGVTPGAPRRETCIILARELYSLESALRGCAEYWEVLPELWGIDKQLLQLVGELPRIWLDGGGPHHKPAAIYTQNDGTQPPRFALQSMGELITIWIQLIDSGVVMVEADGSWDLSPGVALPRDVAQLQVV